MADHLTISELAERTGLRPATIRMWETRYDFPRPARAASGQRRYPAATAELIAAVLTDRSAGLSLSAAIDRARAAGAGPPRQSLYAVLRHARAPAAAHRLPATAMLALSHAIEDEYRARGGQDAILIGAFQRERHYRAAADRWVELARTATAAVVFADFPRARSRAGRPAEIPVDRSDPLHREWAVAAYGSHYAAALVGWEIPGEGQANRIRVFEAVWTTDRRDVAQLVGTGCQLAARTITRLTPLLAAVEAIPSASPDEAQLTRDIAARMIAYLTGTPRPRPTGPTPAPT